MYLCVETEYPSFGHYSAQETRHAYHHRCFAFRHSRRFRLCPVVFIASQHGPASDGSLRLSYSDLPGFALQHSEPSVSNRKAALCRG
jgi:hypothetical protein